MRICVASCDKYHILVPGCTFFIRRFWDDRPWYLDILANTPQDILDELPYNKVYVGPDKGWASNMLAYLKQLEDELVLFLLDDYYLSEPANTKALEQIVALMEDESIGYINLRPWSDDVLYQSEVLFGAWTLWQKVADKPIVGEYDKKTARYLLSLQPGLWRRDFLKRLLKKEEDGWQTEIRGTERARGTKEKMLGILGTFPWPYVNVSRYGTWRENQDGSTTHDWVLGQVGKDNWVYRELDAALSGEGLK